MTKSVKNLSRAKANDRGKEAGRAVRGAVKTDQPAQEIADNEVGIAKTGGKPGETSRHMTGDKP